MREKSVCANLAVLGAALVWFLLVQLASGIYMTEQFFSQGEGESIFFAEEVLHSLLLFFPFLTGAAIVMKRGTGRLCITEIRNMIRRCRYGYLFYVLILLFLHFNFMEGVLYMEGRWIGPSVWLDQSMTSYVVMAFCHLVFAEFSSVLYLTMAPLLCGVVKAEKGYRLCWERI